MRLRLVVMYLWPVTLVALLNRGPKLNGPLWVFLPTIYVVLGLSYFAGWCFERAQKADRW